MKIFTSLFFFLISLSSLAQLPSFDTDKTLKGLKVDSTLKGVSEVRIEKYNIKDDSVFLGGYQPIEVLKFREGRLDYIHFISPENDSISITYYFDKLGRIIGQIRYAEHAGYPLIQYEYDDEQLIAKEIVLNRDSTLYQTTVNYYNEYLLPISKYEFDQDDSLIRYWTNDYDECNNLIKVQYVNTANGPGVSAFGGPFVPWPNDTIVYEINYDGDCHMFSKRKITNSRLNEFTRFMISGDTTISKTIKYNSAGEEFIRSYSKKMDSLKIEGTSYLTPNPSTFEYSYISNEVTKSLHIKNGEITSPYFYRYEEEIDARGNWISKKIFENNKLIKNTIRTISYINRIPINP